MFQESRGSTGSAVMPLYLKGADGGLFEGELGNDLVGAYNRSAMPLSSFQSAVGRTALAQEGATSLTNDIFDGGVTRRMERNAAPVQAARLATARSSSLDALHKTLDAIDSQQASRGLVGDSYGRRLLRFQAGRAAGDATGAATLQNLQQTADIRNYGDITMPMQNINLPFQMAKQNGDLAFMPSDQWLQSIGQRMQPFNMLKLGYTGPFQYQPLPTGGPNSGVANAMGVVSGAGGQIAGAAMNYYSQKQNQQNMLAQIKAWQAGQTTTGTGLSGGNLYSSQTAGVESTPAFGSTISSPGLSYDATSSGTVSPSFGSEITAGGW
jgi:hypothetical protein